MDTTSPDSFAPGKAFYIVDEERLRQLIIDLSPQIQHHCNQMGDLIREIVSLEREKLGLDRPAGIIELEIYNKQKPEDPELVGIGRIAGRTYQAAAWLTQKGKLKISLLPRKRA